MSDHVIIHGDMRCELALMPANSVDAIVCDPPYEIAFMGRGWDRSGIAFDPDTWKACLRVLKPGGHLVAFGAARTMHRITCAIEDAGFEIRDTLQWVFGSGFPKSLDVGKAIDKSAGAEREVVGMGAARCAYLERGEPCACRFNDADGRSSNGTRHSMSTAPATEAARTWHGYGTALKPAHEPITLARKPLDGTVAANVAKWGTGGIDVDGCRVGDSGGTRNMDTSKPGNNAIAYGSGLNGNTNINRDIGAGRWPPNLLLGDGAADVIDGMSGVSASKASVMHVSGAGSVARGKMRPMTFAKPSRDGGASEFFPTFFYTPKASRREREAGLAEAGIEPMTRADVTGRDEGSAGLTARAGTRQHGEVRNTHPTVKPIAIMQWLVRLVSPPRSLDPVILDPFAGSGSTGVACVREGVRFVGVELDERHAAIARARIAHALETRPRSDEDLQEDLFG